MGNAPVVVHRPSNTGGRKVTLRSQGHNATLGTAHSDHDLVVFLGAAGITDADDVLDDPQMIDWQGGPAHQWNAL
ncbi:hypothetical protein AB0F46_41415 [Streptomyces sp. NPDC026665]|uniref:hypothetical protein n=1 Tax=Streptomyces sp. NPDC026665 TaxID=3154798 RepID=UPI0033E4D0FF